MTASLALRFTHTYGRMTARQPSRYVFGGGYDESAHPRGAHGRWVPSGGSEHESESGGSGAGGIHGPRGLGMAGMHSRGASAGGGGGGAKAAKAAKAEAAPRGTKTLEAQRAWHERRLASNAANAASFHAQGDHETAARFEAGVREHGAKIAELTARIQRGASGAPKAGAKATTTTRTAAAPKAPSAPKAEPKAGIAHSGGEQVRHIPIEQIHVGLNPREHFDPEKIAELAASIKEHGLLQPISVRPHEGGYQVIAGERRLRALRALNATHAPAIVHHVDDAKARELALIENINRADMRPSETARAYKGLQDAGSSVKEIAAKTGKSEGHIQQHLDLLKLPADMQMAVDQGHIPQGVIRDLARLTPEHMREAAASISTEQMGLKRAKALTGAYAAKEAQMDLFGGTGGNGTASHAPKALTTEQVSARDRYTAALDRMTQELHGLDDATMAHLAPSVELPHMESQRLSLMVKQLQRMQATLEQEQARRQIEGQHVAASERRAPRQPRLASISDAHLQRLRRAVADALTAARRLTA